MLRRAVRDPAGSAPLHNVPGSLKRVDTVDTAEHHTAFTGHNKLHWSVGPDKKNEPRDDSMLTCRLFCACEPKEDLFFLHLDDADGNLLGLQLPLLLNCGTLKSDYKGTWGRPPGEHGYFLRRGELDHQVPPTNHVSDVYPPLWTWLRRYFRTAIVFVLVISCRAPFWVDLLSDRFQF